jgi:hypothetical protein
MWAVTIVFVATSILGTRGTRRAQADPNDLVARPLVLDEGAVDLRLAVEVGVQRVTFARPLSFAPDAWWGASPRWTIGLIHSSASVDRIDAGATFCVRESAVPSCNRLYRGSGLDVRVSAVTGALAVAPRLRLLVRDVEPFKPAVALGAQLRWTGGRFAIASDPYVRLPLANGEQGNRTALSIPLWLAVQPAHGWMITLHTGFDVDLAVFRDGSYGPFGLGVTHRVTREIDLAIEAGWARLLGPQYDAKHGAIAITVGWRR